jgi:proteic killer suppression protein
MIIKFKNTYLEKLFEGKALPGKPRYGSDIIAKFRKTILMLKLADSIKDIKQLRGLNFESLKGVYKGYYSVRVDSSYRLILAVDSTGTVQISEVITVHDLNNRYQ